MLRFSANISLLFRDRPLEERFQAAKRAGFDAVEIQFPYNFPAQQLARAAANAGVEILLINAPIDGSNSTPGIASRPELVERFWSGLQQAGEYAATLGARKINILAGPERGGSRTRLAENLCYAAELLGKQGVMVMLEALNAADNRGYILTSPAQVIDIIKGCDATNLYLQFDAYHAAMMGLDPAAEFREALPYIGHVQFADAPGRHEPGTGAIDFPGFFRSVTESSYDCWCGAEFHPTSDVSERIKWLEKFL